uniref:PB1 domain-containing protein n=1 Tax=Kalanchoe fedtschenkoi TaxID=63787 RepID=A0A7N0U1T6_KALFE
MDPPPAPPPVAVSPAPRLPYSESIESSPRSRTTESWDDPLPPLPGAPKLRLMCSYGGHIVPRPHDKSLCYVGGDTRMVVVDRNISLNDLSARLAKTLLQSAKPFGLKYQLPNEDLDSLISLSGDEDLDIMIEEYDRVCAAAAAGGKAPRLRLFVFPAKSESVASIGSLLDSSVKSDEWFLSALNGSRALSGGFSDSTSVNCLLGLENDVVSASNNELGISRGLDSEFGNGRSVKASNQDIHSVPDSPMMETTSSFGSTNSTPSMANLPPIRVRVDDGGIRALDRAHDQRLGIEEQYAQISFSAAMSSQSQPPPPIPTTITASTPVQTAWTTSSAPIAGDFSSRVVSDDERSDHSVSVGLSRKSPQPQPQVQAQQLQQKAGGGVDSPRPDSRQSDVPNLTPRANHMGYQEVLQMSSGDNKISANQVDQRNSFMDPNHVRAQLQRQVQQTGNSVQPQMETQQQPQHYSYQQQFIHGGTRYVIQQPGNPMAVPAYYPVYPTQQQAHHPHNQQIQLHPQPYPMYIVQAPQPPQGYNMSMQQPTYPEGTTVVHTGHPQTPPIPNRVPESANAFVNNPNASRTTAPPNPELASTIHRTTASGAQPMAKVAQKLPQQQFVTYSQVNHQPQAMSASNPTYSYEIPDPARAQIYFTQPLGPSLISQYQTMASAQALDAPTQSQNDSMKSSQIRNS